MGRYISLDAVVAEIERRMKLRYDSYKTYNSVSDFIAWEELEYFKEEFLPTLEVKGVDMEKEIDECLKKHNMLAIGKKDFTEIAKHFFELGLKAQKGE